MFRITQYLVGGSQTVYCFRRVLNDGTVKLNDDVKSPHFQFIDKHRFITEVY